MPAARGSIAGCIALRGLPVVAGLAGSIWPGTRQTRLFIAPHPGMIFLRMKPVVYSL